MSYSNGIITAPVSIYDVQRALGIVGGGDLGTLIRTGNINMFAKYKPVRLNMINTLGQWDTTTNKWKDTATWWKGTDLNCGVSFNSFGSFANAKSAVDNQSAVWNSILPTGGSSQPYRLTDFAGYNHRANPSGKVSAQDLYKDMSQYRVFLMAEDDEDALSFDDIIYYNSSSNPRLSTYYFTAVFVNTSDATKIYGYSATETLGDGGYTITIPKSVYNPPITANGWAVGTYKVYCFFTSAKYQDGASNIGSWIPLPGNGIASATADSRAGLLPTEMDVVTSANYLDASYTLTNTGTNYIINWRIEEYGVLKNQDCTLKVYANGTQEGSIRTITSWTADSGSDCVYHQSTALEGIFMQDGANYRLEFTVVYNSVTYTKTLYILNPV